MRQEGQPVQIWTHSFLGLPPGLPTNLAELLIQINKPIKRTKRNEISEGYYRNKVSGDGICKKCDKHKTKEEFPTKTGLICTKCQDKDKRKLGNNIKGKNKK